ncbi:2-deoxy-D-gluconate 3-dehydrogenase [Jeongeupia sp. HS-3]|uniref:SDR family NAD(P)-dependent oxidoreductase n=1 Tax=Jeongeupia sp. HS-3 TaxID=1009682 RepID=UPI0018A5A7A3|nr:SDR family oxidoreductase [Jeongeupia sp. HS-3]BCL76061.1 2-deoxy-D-gluconate 3-dehydrogenase [Jeongeupia sp. HS-3]
MTTLQTSLAGQVAVVTGGGRGLGLFYGQKLASAGARVALLARSQAQLDVAVATIQAEGGHAIGVLVDVIDADTVKRGFTEVEELLGPIDVLINNAGNVGPIGKAWQVDGHDWWHAVEVHLRGSFLCTQEALRRMALRRRGRIINIASNAGAHRWPTASAYSVAKSALIKFTENVAVEAKSLGISLFAFHPGLVSGVGMGSDAIAQGAEPGSALADLIAWMEDEAANGRTIGPEPGAERIIALASGQFDFLSGRYLTVYDDPATLLAQARQIKRSDALMLRIRSFAEVD